MKTRRETSRDGERRRGQGIVEFALVLPILLLLLFGIIEFGRIFQAWLTIENGARQATRYAVSGQYNKSYCQPGADGISDLLTTENDPPLPGGHTYAEMDFADGVYDCDVPANDAARALGVDTEDPNNDWYYQKVEARLQDAARLYSIRDAARAACGTVSVDESVSGDITRNNDFGQGLDGDNTQRGYFHVTLCSTRSPFVFDKDGVYTITQASGRVNPCVKDLDLVRNTGDESFVDDSGGPNDRVAIAITFNHPLITPIRSIADNAGNYIPLHSTREMVIERFRTARVVGLPPSFDIPDPPTATPVAPAPPNVEIVYPAVGDPCADVEVVLQARACDPDNTEGVCDVTADNGTGIANVRLWLQDPWGRNVSDFTDASPEYCGQSSDSDPCLALDFASGQWPNGQTIIPGMYTLYAIATDDDGEQTTTSRQFEVCIPLDCTVYSMDNFRYTNTSYAVFEVDVHNDGVGSPEVAGLRVTWPRDACLESDWRIDWIEWSNQTIWGSGVNDYTPPTDAMIGGSDRASFVEGRSFPAMSDRRLEVDLDGRDQWKCALRYPGGSYFNFEVLLDDGCLISYSPDLVPTPTPDCDGLAAGEISYLDSPDWVGAVVSNTSTLQDFDLVGFDFGWPVGASTAFPGLRTDAVKFSDTAWNTAWSGETVWDGNDQAGPTVGCHPCYEDVCGGLDPSWNGTHLGELPQGDVDTWMTEYDANSGSVPNLQASYFPGEYSLTMYFANLWGGICPVEAIRPDIPSGCGTFTSTLLYPTGDNLQSPMRNVGSDEFLLNDIHFIWPIPDATPVPGMYVNYTRWLQDNDIFWGGDDDTPPTDINLSPPYLVTSPWGQTFEADYNKPSSWNPGYLASDLYLHGRQFHLTFDYETLSGTPCTPLEVDGKYGPVIQVVDPPRRGGGYEVHPDYSPINTESTHAAGACIAGEFSIQAIAYDRDYGTGAADGSGINWVCFQVQAPDGHIVNLNGEGDWKCEYSAAYCGFGGNYPCGTRDTTNLCHTWDDTDCTGTDYFEEGVHTLLVRAEDRDSPGNRLRTLFITHFEICDAYDATPTPLPLPSPTATSEPTPVTPTSTPTPIGPTSTSTPITPTSTPTPVTPTNTPDPDASPTNTSTPTATRTPLPGGGD